MSVSDPEWINGYEYLMDGGSKEVLIRRAYSILSDFYSRPYDPMAEADALEAAAHKLKQAVGGADWIDIWMQLNKYAAKMRPSDGTSNPQTEHC